MRLEDVFPSEIGFLLNRGLMTYVQTENVLPTTSGTAALRLTPEGVRQKNGVIAQFYNGAVKAHLLRLVAGNAVSLPMVPEVNPKDANMRMRPII